MLDMTEGHLAGTRLLLVEDEMLVGLWLEDLVEEWGCQVVGRASTLETAIQMAETIEADAALLDLNLDGEHTIAVAAVLVGRRIPFVVVTGYGSGAVLPASAAAKVRKPVDPHELRAALSRALFGLQPSEPS
jgi:CheY-like chemotaxis protein